MMLASAWQCWNSIRPDNQIRRKVHCVRPVSYEFTGRHERLPVFFRTGVRSAPLLIENAIEQVASVFLGVLIAFDDAFSFRHGTRNQFFHVYDSLARFGIGIAGNGYIYNSMFPQRWAYDSNFGWFRDRARSVPTLRFSSRKPPRPHPTGTL